jgi:hypothetical protein
VLQTVLQQARQAVASGDAVAAHRAYQQAHLLAPQDPHVRLDLAAACLACGTPDQALEHANAAAQRTAGWRLQLVLATAQQQLQQADEAARHLGLALTEPSLPDAQRANTLQQQAGLLLNAFGDASGAALALQAAALVDPALVLEADLASLVADLYLGGRSAAQITAGFVALAGRLRPPQPPDKPPRASGKRLRIGLVSQQFCASPVGFLALGALSALARDADLLYFDRGAKLDWAQAAFQATAHRWLRCAALNADQLHQLLVAADLDAVIDLSGWTDPQALCALAGRPVPRQLKWVGGQSSSTGLRCFDGFVADARQVPAAAAKLYTEPVLHAEQGYVTYSAPPYAQTLAAARPPAPPGRPAEGVFALVANPAKISEATAAALRRLKPTRLVLIDQRWRHQGTRDAAQKRLGSLLDKAEFVTPANHPEYLQTLQALDASFVDTLPYSMGLTAIELRLLGKHIAAAPRSQGALMCERHCVAHLGASGFDHHAGLAAQLLGWCRT